MGMDQYGGMSIVDSLRFAEAFMRNPAQVGAIAPSSPFLARYMLADLPLETGDSVIEFGPGTGAFTTALARMIPDVSQYLGIECDQRMIDVLRRRLPQLSFVHGWAEQAHRLHGESALGPVKVIVSGLPFATLSRQAQDSIMSAVQQVLAPGGQFRTFQYAHSYNLPSSVRFRRRMNERFEPVRRSKFVLRNLPPACVLTWQR